MPKVLIVDDSGTVRTILREFLSKVAGIHSFAEAADGVEAIMQVREHKPDLIILDIAMPVMNGLKAATILKEVSPETPILLFTMYDMLAEDTKADAVVSKVEGLGSLGQWVREFFAKSAAVSNP
jgi:CheY-like chemotaxis protein